MSSLSNYVGKKLDYLYGICGTSAGKAIMANLRHGVGERPGELPELWGIVFDDGFPKDLMGKEKPSYAEWAVYTALTMYALHMQGKDKNENMHAKDISLGRAVARLVKTPDDRERVQNRFNVVVTATDPENLAYHLRGIIRMLGGESIPLDYMKLAEQLYGFYFDETASNIKLSWGRDFCTAIYQSEKELKGETENGDK